MEAKVKDYPDFIKRGGGVINTNANEYARAKARAYQFKRIDNLEDKMCDMQIKLGEIMSLLKQLTPD